MVALTHRRFMDFGGRSMNMNYAAAVEAARACKALVQLDPLTFADRENYLKMALQVDKALPSCFSFADSKGFFLLTCMTGIFVRVARVRCRCRLW